MLKGIRFHTSHNTYNAKSANGNPTNPIGIEFEAGWRRQKRGEGLALKLSSLALVKYQQPMKDTPTGIGISPFLIVKYRTISFTFL